MRRVILLRRMLCKHSALKSIVDRILGIYHDRQVFGTDCSPDVLRGMTPAPYPGMQSRAAFNCPKGRAAGPIGLLLHQLRDFCMGMDRTLSIFDSSHGVVHVLYTPFQHVRPMLMSMVTQVRAKIAAAARSDLIDMHSFDSEVYHRAMADVPVESLNRLRLLHAMGGCQCCKDRLVF